MKPYLIIDKVGNADSDFYRYEHMIERLDDKMRRFWFADAHQRIALGAENSELLIEEFSRLFGVLNVDAWIRSLDQATADGKVLSSWLR